jgi:hypothetical protein
MISSIAVIPKLSKEALICSKPFGLNLSKPLKPFDRFSANGINQRFNSGNENPWWRW